MKYRDGYADRTVLRFDMHNNILEEEKKNG